VSRIFVDTSAWYAYMRKDDPDHVRCKAALGKHAKGRVTSNFVFDELVTLLRYRADHAVAVRAGDVLLAASDLEIVRVQPDDEAEAWKLFTRHRDKECSYTDCTSFALMRRLGVTHAIATDKHFHQAGFHVEGGE